ncbi:phenazine biosynthesis protein PhzF family [Parafrankia irregularis]|uniref:Phenazine biosynthesis protein PhzF family n=1 Tax=Parafrankia irregularis TaxID=795642 RepID=A0A0S4QLL5_9ACTN|nr:MULTISPECIES: PhzF family phenazine biosynthesis protein [Parafrankia]MBE3202150.1 PhzF family phenazine biosynthesis protein [Parafrankia sp. CH37]CUU55935.1 phenazine biosynthesis protein PhzF family [Parafrankia irregularis]
MRHAFQQVDVFTDRPCLGNPLAVVLDAEGLTAAQMQRFAAWTNLSETTFVVAPTTPAADYRVRIFTPASEVPFAGHPTLGTAHAWLGAGGAPRDDDRIIQECDAGLITVRREAVPGEAASAQAPSGQAPSGLAFAAPPLLRYEQADAELLVHLAEVLRIAATDIVAAQWVDNGPGWVAVMLDSAEAVLAIQPGTVDLSVGVIGPHPEGGPAAFEVRAFSHLLTTVEDPVTGSLNASLATWLFDTGVVDGPYTARQGTRLGREGQVRLSRDEAGTIWVGGDAVTCIVGEVDL